MWLNLKKETNDDKVILGIDANKSDLYKNAKISNEVGKQYPKKIGAIWESTSFIMEDCRIDKLVDKLVNKYIEREALRKKRKLRYE